MSAQERENERVSDRERTNFRPDSNVRRTNRAHRPVGPAPYDAKIQHIPTHPAETCEQPPQPRNLRAQHRAKIRTRRFRPLFARVSTWRHRGYNSTRIERATRPANARNGRGVPPPFSQELTSHFFSVICSRNTHTPVNQPRSSSLIKYGATVVGQGGDLRRPTGRRTQIVHRERDEQQVAGWSQLNYSFRVGAVEDIRDDDASIVRARLRNPERFVSEIRGI